MALQRKKIWEKENPYKLQYQIEKFEGENAVLKNHDPLLGEIKWPIRKLPEKSEIGQSVTLQVDTSEGSYEIMRKLLQEIMN